MSHVSERALRSDDVRVFCRAAKEARRWLLGSNVTPAERWLSQWATDWRTILRRHGTIAREGCIHRTAAARATAELVERGLIVCIQRGDLAR